MIKLKSRKFFKRTSEVGRSAAVAAAAAAAAAGGRRLEVGWELRPVGMLVQKRAHDSGGGGAGGHEGTITVRISTGAWWRDVVVGATAKFGELKKLVSTATGIGGGRIKAFVQREGEGR